MKLINPYDKRVEASFQRKSRRRLMAALQRIKMSGQAEELRNWIEQQQARRED